MAFHSTVNYMRMDAYYTDSLGESNSIHPNSAGHTIIARALQKHFEQNIVDTHGTIWQ